MAISISSTFKSDIPASTYAASTWTITGIDVPEDATVCILMLLGGWMTSGGDHLDISNFDGDADDHFTYVLAGLDAYSGRHAAGTVNDNGKGHY